MRITKIEITVFHEDFAAKETYRLLVESENGRKVIDTSLDPVSCRPLESLDQALEVASYYTNKNK